MRIRWTPAAAADLQDISDYLKEHHPHYRQPTMRKLYDFPSAVTAACAIRSLDQVMSGFQVTDFRCMPHLLGRAKQGVQSVMSPTRRDTSNHEKG